jgi:tetratricopeptide (TPR) repeat protein
VADSQGTCREDNIASFGPIVDITALLNQGLSFHHSGRLADAEAVYQQILKASPGHFEALHLLGIIQYQRGNYADSIHQIGLALETNPNHADAHGNRGNALQELKRIDEALASYDRALALKPDNPKRSTTGAMRS